MGALTSKEKPKTSAQSSKTNTTSDHHAAVPDKPTEAMQHAKQVLQYIKQEALTQAVHPPSISTGSAFYKTLRSKYLDEFLKAPSPASGKGAVDKMGKQLEGRNSGSNVDVKDNNGKWRRTTDPWETGAVNWFNEAKIPKQYLGSSDLFKNLKKLPSNIGAATDVLRLENRKDMNHLDVPHLLGKPNPATATAMDDVIYGGKNPSQLMHWATGAKYSGQDPKAMHELFLLYEMWHLEGWDVFGQDSINDLIAEEQGRLLGAELLKGDKSSIKDERTLLFFLNKSFMESRAWVGALLRERGLELDSWILSKEQKSAAIHWNEDEKEDLWNSKTIYQMFIDGTSMEDVKKSGLVGSQIEIYSLLYEAYLWERSHGKIELTDLEKALIQGKLNSILKVITLTEEGGKLTSDDYSKAGKDYMTL